MRHSNKAKDIINTTLVSTFTFCIATLIPFYYTGIFIDYATAFLIATLIGFTITSLIPRKFMIWMAIYPWILLVFSKQILMDYSRFGFTMSFALLTNKNSDGTVNWNAAGKDTLIGGGALDIGFRLGK